MRPAATSVANAARLRAQSCSGWCRVAWWASSSVSGSKSSQSSGQTECVEVAWLGSGRVGVRDSKNPS
ncbi:DUF397 domain-containing protein [Nocardia sp. NPDC059180]|uniref:DUF397 domain-containing protein n=1 Tax=Nocardia sp. NPDC059180 TaxID=3346761 RepID=UPI0036A64FC0